MTILHQLALDHEQLTYRHTGRDYRLTDVSGKVVRDILDLSGWSTAPVPRTVE